METKHTPGPWEIERTNTGPIFIESTQGTEAEINSGHDATEANAKLIAAAPELLQVLIRIKAFLGPGDRVTIYRDDVIYEEIENAIKKATI